MDRVGWEASRVMFQETQASPALASWTQQLGALGTGTLAAPCAGGAVERAPEGEGAGLHPRTRAAFTQGHGRHAEATVHAH